MYLSRDAGLTSRDVTSLTVGPLTLHIRFHLLNNPTNTNCLKLCIIHPLTLRPCPILGTLQLCHVKLVLRDVTFHLRSCSKMLDCRYMTLRLGPVYLALRLGAVYLTLCLGSIT